MVGARAGPYVRAMRRLLVLLTTVFLLYASTAHADPLTRSASGANGAAIQATVDQFRADLGTLNANNGTAPETGRREINWDGVPDQFASPNPFPPTFFNASSPRGVVFSTPGSGFRVSRTAAQSDVRFSDIDPSYGATFGTFSPQRLLTALGSNVTDVAFMVPTLSSTTPALTRGFGVVFTDVDTAGSARVQFFDRAGNELLSLAAPTAPGSGGLSFVAATLPDGPGIARVRLTSGSTPLAAGATDGSSDVVVMDDFIYGEPSADGDGVATTSDNCADAFNPDQANLDGDGQGDVCDEDDDGDGVPDATDPAPRDAAVPGPASPGGDTGSGGGTPPPPADTIAPGLTKLAIKRAKKGFKVSYTLTEPATVAFGVEKKVRHRWKRLKGGFSKAGKAGANAFRFSGKLRGRRLAPGTYRLVVTASDASKNAAKPTRTRFSVRRGR